jgi:hypothetical protein
LPMRKESCRIGADTTTKIGRMGPSAISCRSCCKIPVAYPARYRDKGEVTREKWSGFNVSFLADFPMNDEEIGHEEEALFDRTDRIDPKKLTMIVNERDHVFDRRSSSAWAKYAEALRRMSVACRSSRFSRSKAFSLAFMSVDTP